MSKRNFLTGGAVLFFITSLALIGCRGAGDPTPSPPQLSVKGIALGTDMVIVTFNQPLAEIDKAMGKAYTMNKNTYRVTKKGTTAAFPIGDIGKGADDYTVTLPVAGIHTTLTAGEFLEVTLEDMGKAPDYTPLAPTVDSATATSGTTIGIKFSDGVKFIDATAPEGQFSFPGGSFNVSAAKVLATDSRLVEITVGGGAITPATDLKISYTPDQDKKLTSITGLAGLDVGKFENQTVGIQFPLTATAASTDATAFSLTFSEALYDGKTSLAGGTVVTALFDQEGTGTVTSATVDTNDVKTVVFVIAGAVKGDKVIPNAAKTVMTQAGVPWKQTVGWDETAWTVPTP
jgi:hypothetical protein